MQDASVSRTGAVLLLIAGALASFSASRAAADAAACTSKDTAEAVACLERAVKDAEAALEDAMKTARAALAGGALTGDTLKKTRDLFEASATHWRAARDENCQAYEFYDTALGAGGAQVRLNCLLHETLQRQTVMKRMYSSE